MSAGSITALVETLVSVGATPEMILAAVRTAEAQKDAAIEQSREKARNRVQKWRERQSETSRNVTQRSVATTKRLTRAEDSSSNKQITGQEEKKDTAPAALSDLQGFKAELSELDAERVEAIVKHRRSRKAQLTAHAARLFKADAAKAGLTLAAAVDTCISRNWITVKADWLNGQQRQSTAPPKPKSIGEMFREDARQLGIIPNDQPASTQKRRLVESDRTEQGSSPGISRRFAVPANVLGSFGSG